jgi:hypothetical protein
MEFLMGRCIGSSSPTKSHRAMERQYGRAEYSTSTNAALEAYFDGFSRHRFERYSFTRDEETIHFGHALVAEAESTDCSDDVFTDSLKLFRRNLI